MRHTPLWSMSLALLLAGCGDHFYEPPNADVVACMKSRPNDSHAETNCYWMLVRERRSK